MSKELMVRWEIASALFVILAGSALHFVYNWCGGWRGIAWLAPVNESTWEHFKMCFWTGLFFAFLEYFALRKETQNFWLARTMSLLTMLVLIALIFYGYKALLGTHYLALDIALYVVAVVIGQWLSYAIIISPVVTPVIRFSALVVLVGLITAFVVFTYHPPQIFLFEDPRSHQYGIICR